MKLTETPLLDDEGMAVLAVAYRARPETVPELAALLEATSIERLDATLLALKRAGFLRIRGARLSLESPYAAFVAVSQSRTERLQEETTRTVAMMAALPLLIRNWDLGEAKPGQEHPLVARIVHGREDRWTVWRRHLAEEKPKRPSWVLPDLSMLREMFAEHTESIAGTMRRGMFRARILVRPNELREPVNQELVAASSELGVEVRVLDDLPGWFYVDDDRLAGLPIVWGETRPSSILLVRTPPVISALNLVFDSLWLRAEPAIAEARGWEPIVRLLAQGMTDDAVGRFLGLDVRTVRRRVAEAMDDLGATSRLALGIAWERKNKSTR